MFYRALCVLLLCASSVFAQCPGGCPVDIGNLPQINQSAKDYGPVAQTGHLVSIVRIVNVINPGEMAKGTGTYVNYEGLYCVVTASHVIRDAKKIFVVFRYNGKSETIQGQVISNDPVNDCAIIGLYKHPDFAEDVVGKVAYAADTEGLENQVLQNAGYGGDENLYAGHGKIFGYKAPSSGMPKSWMEIGSSARFGDSGGPIFTASGKLVGVLWGKSNDSIIAVRCNTVHVVLRDALSKVAVEETQVIQPRPLPRQQPKNRGSVVPPKIQPPVLPWRDKIENEIDGIKRAPKNPISPPPVIVAPEIEVNPAPPVKPDEPKVSGRYRADPVVYVPIIAGVCLLGLLIGVGYQWKKTYSK